MSQARSQAADFLTFAILGGCLLKGNFASLNKLALVVDLLSPYFLSGLMDKTQTNLLRDDNLPAFSFFGETKP